MRRRNITFSTLRNSFQLLVAWLMGRVGAQVSSLKSKKLGPADLAPRSPDEITAGALNAEKWWSVLKQAVSGWTKHAVSTLGAAIAYYSLFSMGPLILIVIAVAGLVFGEEAVRGQVSRQISDLLGEQGAKGIENMLAVAGKPSEGVFAAIVSTGALVFAAIGVVVQLKSALNAVWEVESRASSGIWGFFRNYAVSLAGVVSLGFLLLVSLLLTTVLAAVGTMLSGSLPELLLHVASLIVSFSITTLLFAMMFKWLPDTEIGWREVLPGAILTAVLFEIGKFLIGFYIGKQGLESTFGAGASLVVILIWVYYSAQIVLFGAEFTHAYAQISGPRRNARSRRETNPGGRVN